MKNGAPTTAVRIETGISLCVAVRATVSITSMKRAPMTIEAGSTKRLFAPKIMRAAWGTRRPTQPMRPHIETTEAVIMVAAMMTPARILRTGMPRLAASSVGRVVTLRRTWSRTVLSG